MPLPLQKDPLFPVIATDGWGAPKLSERNGHEVSFPQNRMRAENKHSSRRKSTALTELETTGGGGVLQYISKHWQTPETKNHCVPLTASTTAFGTSQTNILSDAATWRNSFHRGNKGKVKKTFSFLFTSMTYQFSRNRPCSNTLIAETPSNGSIAGSRAMTYLNNNCTNKLFVCYPANWRSECHFNNKKLNCS